MNLAKSRLIVTIVLTFLFAYLICQNGNSQDETFEQVEKIFVARCFECHIGESAESGFRLDGVRPSVLEGGDSGEESIVPGDSDSGRLMELITSDDESDRMPPEGEPLSKKEIDIIRAWIQNGAKMSRSFTRPSADLWSFKPIKKVVPPTSGQVTRLAQNSIDLFIADRLAQKGLACNPHESRSTLIRRLFLITLGILPTPDQVNRFIEDPSDQAYEKLVDRVLASTQYGERWAQHWLDIIRFGETQGFETNRERPNAWPYRDYVIDSLNSDKPYDQFVLEQIAGDQLGNQIGTGFIVAGPHDIVKSPDINLTLMQRQDELADIVNVTGTTFLGLTVGCARCHDHKFDPISQKDFYSMQAIFAGVNHGERPIPLDPESAALTKSLREKRTLLKDQLGKFIRLEGNSLLVIDDDANAFGQTGQGFQVLEEPAGEGINPAGVKRGHKDDPGSINQSANISQGKYTWWRNQPGKWLAAYHPKRNGRYRIWISWGAGHKTHSPDAVYELDLDGDLSTDNDRKQIAKVDQTKFADGTGGVVNLALWSGFKDAGIHELRTSSKILLKGGENGTAVTSDVVVLEFLPENSKELSSQVLKATKPPIRPTVKPTGNIEVFQPVDAKYIRFTINATNISQACIDELEIFSGGKNIALAKLGAQATSGGDFVHPYHKLEHINDGAYGNPKSWIAKELQGWVQIELPSVQTIDRIEWARDREGKFSDRIAIDYKIEVAKKAGEWSIVSSSKDRLPFNANRKKQMEYDFSRFAKAESERGKRLYSELQLLDKQLKSLSTRATVYAGTFSKPAATHRLYRGDPFQKREQVEPNTIDALGSLELKLDAEETSRRVTFAKWLVSQDNPLLARVIVNRIWQHSFGQGIVATPNDFGKSGRPPTHPELLDWLAFELRESGWSLKHIHRLVLTSHTFRQSSQPETTGMAKDANCQFLWRFPPRRMEAEGIRDAILVSSGVLDTKVGGKGFDGFEVQLENVRHFFPKKNYGPADWRRMIYMTKVRQERDSVFGAFDCPDASQIIDRRSRSTTPLQSLNLLNSHFVLQQAELMASRLKAEAALRRESPVMIAYKIAYSRPASAGEIRDGNEFISEFGLKAFCRALLNSNEFLFIQ